MSDADREFVLSIEPHACRVLRSGLWVIRWGFWPMPTWPAPIQQATDDWYLTADAARIALACAVVVESLTCCQTVAYRRT